MDLALFSATVLFMVSMTFSPGPNNLLCAAHGSQHGLRQTLSLMMGMFFGFTVLALAIGIGAVFIEQNANIIQILVYAGALYIAYLSYKIAFSPPLKTDESTQILGFSTGLLLQLVNGKAWIHFIILMTTFATQFGTGYGIKILFVLVNSTLGFTALCTWAFAGTLLRKIFNTPGQVRILNLSLGFSLLLVAIWIALPH
jgi:threonine/homoserine/homoserine lactone efflux protein